MTNCKTGKMRRRRRGRRRNRSLPCARTYESGSSPAGKRTTYVVQPAARSVRDRLRGRRTARGVGIEAHEDAFGILVQFGRLFAREGRPERRDRIREPRLMEGDAVEVALDDDQRVAFARRASREVEGEEALAFRVDGRRGRVEIFRFRIVEHASAEGDGLRP